LEARNLTCQQKPQLCSFSDQRAPDKLIASGRWRKAAYLPDIGSENNIQFKRWSYVSVNDESYYIGTAIVQFYYVADVFLYLVDKRNSEQWLYTGQLPLGLGVKATMSSVDGCTTWGTPRATGSRPWIEMCGTHQDMFSLRAALTVTSQISQKQKQLQVQVTMVSKDDFVLAYPLDGNEQRLSYVHKLAGAPVLPDSFLSLDDEKHELVQASAGLDWTKGRHLYRTFWKWVSLNDARAKVTRGSGNTAEEMIGINLSDLVYDMAVENGQKFSTENAVWVNGQVFPVSVPIEILVPQNPAQDEWRIFSANSPEANVVVDLRFKPAGAREDHTYLWLLMSDFIQPFGRFSGTIVIKDPASQLAIKIEIDESSAFGVVENHQAYW